VNVFFSVTREIVVEDVPSDKKKYYKKDSLKLQLNRAHVISLISMPLEATSVAISNFTSPFRKSARA
jgi:hypothetical protein